MLSVSAEDIRTIGQIRTQLVDCTTKDGVEGVFSRFAVSDFLVKTMLLRLSMQIREVFGIPDAQEPSDKDVYEEELEFFLDGTWRDLV